MLFSVCIVTCGAVGAPVWEVLVFRHEDAACLCRVSILWQFSMLHLHDLQFVNAGREATIWKRHTPEPVS